MECVHRALNGGFVEDLWGFNGGSGDDFFVDELLDFSNGYSETEELPSETEEKTEDKSKDCFNSQEKQEIEPENGFVSLTETELSVPEEGLESLEWLSHFVEDSFSDYSLAGKLPPENGSAAAVTPPAQPCFATPVHTKARTKRARTGSRIWPVISPSSSSSSSPASSTTTSFKPFNQEEYFFPVEKRVKKKAADNGSVGRRCSHCGVTKTPQWRAGPLGSKTLCNACGVRFKSGRLVPEYRPACSPTFSSELHSNNHRKVLEMRRKKMEIEAPGVPSPDQSFCKSN